MEETTPPPRQLLVKRVQQEARDIRAFDMRLTGDGDEAGAPLTFTPGQVALLRPAGSDERASYFAFASAPEDDELEFLIKRAGNVNDGDTKGLYHLEEGARVELTGIVGHGFSLDANRGCDLVLIAMGTGVAPLRSALRHALRRPADFGQLVVLYGARTPDDFCYRDETDTWRAAGVELRQVISKPDGYEWAGSTGYVQSLLEHIFPSLSAPVALVCGSPDMITHTRDRLQEMGLPLDSILTNY